MSSEIKTARSDSDAKSYYRHTGHVVNNRISRLQERFLAGDPSARGALASLRNAVGTFPGNDPKVWQFTMLEDNHTYGDGPTGAERALHIAMTLWAGHMQGQSQPMHVPNRTFAQQARRLVDAKGDAGGKSTKARFDAIITAESVEELSHHMRSFIGQLRREGWGFDYARLADDLERYQYPDSVHSVRLQWARQYSRIQHDSQE